MCQENQYTNDGTMKTYNKIDQSFKICRRHYESTEVGVLLYYNMLVKYILI